MLLECHSDKRDVRILEDFLDFNFAEFGRLSETKHLNIVNNFAFDIHVNWALLKVENRKTGELIENPYRISPSQ